MDQIRSLFTRAVSATIFTKAGEIWLHSSQCGSSATRARAFASTRAYDSE